MTGHLPERMGVLKRAVASGAGNAATDEPAPMTLETR
jgi:hypothetical protein